MARIECRQMVKRYGRVTAVHALDLVIEDNEFVVLLGPSGCGKTTTLNVASGIYKPTNGQIFLDGVDITKKLPHQRCAHGLGRTFQNIRLFPQMTVLENVMVGAQRANNPIQRGEDALRERALSTLEFVGIREKAHEVVSQLSYGHQRLVEIARTMAGYPKLILLDEPAAGLNQTEKGELVRLIRRMRDEHAMTILLIDHDMRLIQSVSDVITVLNFGKKIAEGNPDEVLDHPEVVAAYLGEPDASA